MILSSTKNRASAAHKGLRTTKLMIARGMTRRSSRGSLDGADLHRNLCKTDQNRVARRHVMGEAVSGSVTRSIAELPDLEALFPESGAEAFSEDYAELFALDAPIVRAGPHRVLVFRNADLRAIAANPVVGNMSPGTRANRDYLDRPTAGAPPASAAVDEDRAHLSRLYDNWIFTANPPIHGPTRNLFARPLMPVFMPRFIAVADRIVLALIDDVAGQGEIDFSFQFTERLAA